MYIKRTLIKIHKFYEYILILYKYLYISMYNLQFCSGQFSSKELPLPRPVHVTSLDVISLDVTFLDVISRPIGGKLTYLSSLHPFLLSAVIPYPLSFNPYSTSPPNPLSYLSFFSIATVNSASRSSP